ncbi:MAG TPA: DUF2179 domain-containing protein [Candidatus Gracilibacteria bacterium]|nr:DUF2179 domain-containing protein [Candidatus Gracilibacteria bacterium]
METLFSPEIYKWLVLPLSIFLARAIDETIGTLRIMFLSKGNKTMAPIMGFFEVLIWIVIIGQIMQNLDNALCYVAYAGGFAVGNLVGMIIEKKLAMGTMMINVITRKNTTNLQKSLKANNYGFTRIGGKDIDGFENMLFIVVKRKELDNVIRIINEFNPHAFFSVNEISKVNEGNYPLKTECRNAKFNLSIFKRILLPQRFRIQENKIGETA